MRAAFLLEPGKIEIRETDSPRPGPGEVVVAIECATTCGTDLKAYRRGHPFIAMPGRFGHQYSGRIASVGPGVVGFEPGMPILGVHSAPCGQCRLCHRGRASLCERLREQLVIGAFAEELRIPERVVRHNLYPRPAGMSAQRAAFLEPVSCALHALDILDLASARRILVLGLGSMGLLFCKLLPLVTGAEFVGAGWRPTRLAVARSTQAADIWDLEAVPLAERIAAQREFDCVIECTGTSEGWRDAIAAALPASQILFFGGLPKGTSFPVDSYRLHYEELRLLGSFHFTPDDVRRSVELLANPALHLEDMVAGTLPLERLEEALEAMAEGRAIKYAIDPHANAREPKRRARG